MKLLRWRTSRNSLKFDSVISYVYGRGHKKGSAALAAQLEVERVGRKEILRRRDEFRERMRRVLIKKHKSGYLMDNMWEAQLPDVPHVNLRKEGVDARCYVCGEISAETIRFQHNEGCHDVHCRRCLERMLELFP